jgi:hypothetical protein
VEQGIQQALTSEPVALAFVKAMNDLAASPTLMQTLQDLFAKAPPQPGRDAPLTDPERLRALKEGFSAISEGPEVQAAFKELARSVQAPARFPEQARALARELSADPGVQRALLDLPGPACPNPTAFTQAMLDHHFTYERFEASWVQLLQLPVAQDAARAWLTAVGESPAVREHLANAIAELLADSEFVRLAVGLYTTTFDLDARPPELRRAAAALADHPKVRGLLPGLLTLAARDPSLQQVLQRSVERITDDLQFQALLRSSLQPAP